MRVQLFLEKMMWGIIICLALAAFPFAYWAATPDELIIIDGDAIESQQITFEETVETDVFKKTEILTNVFRETEAVETVAVETVIQDVSTYPEETVVEPIPEAETTYSDYDIDLIARCVWLEARGESYNGQVAVAEVILNRVASDSYPDTIEGVIWQPGQFTSAPAMGRAAPTEVQYSAVYDAIEGRGVLLNEDCVFFSVGRSCGSYYTTIGNHVFGCE